MSDSEYRHVMRLSVNGKQVPEEKLRNVQPERTLLDFLREDLGLTGTKLGCGEGGCGACTVMVTRGEDHHRAVNACLAPICSVDGCNVTTVEGLGRGACSSCRCDRALSRQPVWILTPGFVMALFSSLSQSDKEGGMDAESVFDGNCAAAPATAHFWTLLAWYHHHHHHHHHPRSTKRVTMILLLAKMQGYTCAVQHAVAPPVDAGGTASPAR